MKNISTYITEKLKINKDVKSNNINRTKNINLICKLCSLDNRIKGNLGKIYEEIKKFISDWVNDNEIEMIASYTDHLLLKSKLNFTKNNLDYFNDIDNDDFKKVVFKNFINDSDLLKEYTFTNTMEIGYVHSPYISFYSNNKCFLMINKYNDSSQIVRLFKKTNN